MPFMFLILAFLLAAVVWGFFHANPYGVSATALVSCNIIVLALGAAAASASAVVLYGDAVLRRPDEPGLALYLSIMAGGTAFMIVVAVGGLVRNLFLFPLSRRSAPKT
ncbi:MAG: hypothetical protein ACM30H_01600 [Clostridia bacterium]